MPSHSACAVACLLVFLGVVLASSRHPQYVPQKLRDAVSSITDELDLKRPEIGSNPLFGALIRSLNTSSQRRDDVQLMNATLNVYLRVFSKMEDQEMSSNLQAAVSYMRSIMERLQTHVNRISLRKEELLAKLNRIEVDDRIVQQKALAEVMEVYQVMSVVTFRSH